MCKSVKTISRLLLLVYLLAVAFLCFWKFDEVAQVGSLDKVAHFFLFLPFSFLAYGAIGRRFKSNWKTLFVLIAVFLLGSVIAALTEIVQARLAYRSGDVLDFRADTFALVLGALIIFVFEICSEKS